MCTNTHGFPLCKKEIANNWPKYSALRVLHVSPWAESRWEFRERNCKAVDTLSVRTDCRMPQVAHYLTSEGNCAAAKVNQGDASSMLSQPRLWEKAPLSMPNTCHDLEWVLSAYWHNPGIFPWSRTTKRRQLSPKASPNESKPNLLLGKK